MIRNRAVPNKLPGNALAGMAATGIYLLSRLLLTPFVLTYVTLAEFGLWSMCFVILSYASMGAFGVNNTYIRYGSLFHAEGRDSEISKLLSTGVFGMLIFYTLFWLALFFCLPMILDGFHVDTAAQARSTASVMILGTAAVFGVELTLGGFRSVIEGLQEIALVKKIFTGAALVEVVAIVFFLTKGAGVQGMLYAYVVRVALETGACMLASRRLLRSLRLSPRLVSREHIRHFLVFGGKIQVLGAISVFLGAFDRMVISAILGLSSAGMFEVGRKVPFTAKSISASVFGPLLPAAASLDCQWERDTHPPWPDRLKGYLHIALLTLCAALVPVSWVALPIDKYRWLPWTASFIAAGAAFFLLKRLREHFRRDYRLRACALRGLYLQGVRYVNLINITLLALVAAMAGPLVSIWLGPGYEKSIPVMILLCAAYFAQQGTGPISMVFRGINRTGRELEFLLVQLILLLVWVPAGTYAFGLTGAAGAFAAGTIVAFLFFSWRSNHVFQLNFKEFAVYTLSPGLLPLAAAAAIYGLTVLLPCRGRMEAAIQVVGCGLGYMALLLPLIWKLVLTADEKKYLMGLNPLNRGTKQPC